MVDETMMWPVHVAKTRPALYIPPTPFRVSRMQVWEFESPVNAGHDLSLPLVFCCAIGNDVLF
jgi:hypothetical protein